MAIVHSSFPDNVWDGSTGNNWRSSRHTTLDPDHEDWDRIVSEVIATQETVAAAGGTQPHTHDAADIVMGVVDTARLGSGVADATTFLRGDQTWQPQAAPAAPDGFITVVSSVDQDVTNAQNADHTEFQFPVTAGKRYMIDMLFWSSANLAAADYEFRLAVAAGLMDGRGTTQGMSLAGGVTNLLITAFNVAATGVFTVGTESDFERGTVHRLAFVFVPDTSTTFKFQFGNNTVGASNTSRTGKGSVMRWKQMN